MLYDTHLHTDFSTDSDMKFHELQALLGQTDMGFIITEHMDLKYPKPGKFVFSPDDYFRVMQPYRNSRLLLGVEIGLRQDCITENRQLVETYPFDFVLGSIHVVNEQDLYYNPFYDGRSKAAAYEEYFKAMSSCLTSYDFIDSLGHIDYIARYAPYSDPEIYYSEFTDMIDEVLRLVAKQNIALEINTRRFIEKDTVAHLMPIYRRFYELGGKYVTIGSDAHRVSEVGRELKRASEIAEACQLKVVYFENRQAIEVIK